MNLFDSHNTRLLNLFFHVICFLGLGHNSTRNIVSRWFGVHFVMIREICHGE